MRWHYFRQVLFAGVVRDKNAYVMYFIIFLKVSYALRMYALSSLLWVSPDGVYANQAF